MRSRLAIVLVLVLALGTMAFVLGASAYASPPLTLVQEIGEGEDNPAQPGEQEQERRGGQQREGGGEAEGEGGGGEETDEPGPPWTYQMSWITLALLFLMALALGGLYYRIVVVRRREGF